MSIDRTPLAGRSDHNAKRPGMAAFPRLPAAPPRRRLGRRRLRLMFSKFHLFAALLIVDDQVSVLSNPISLRFLSVEPGQAQAVEPSQARQAGHWSYSRPPGKPLAWLPDWAAPADGGAAGAGNRCGALSQGQRFPPRLPLGGDRRVASGRFGVTGRDGKRSHPAVIRTASSASTRLRLSARSPPHQQRRSRKVSPRLSARSRRRRGRDPLTTISRIRNSDPDSAGTPRSECRPTSTVFAVTDILLDRRPPAMAWPSRELIGTGA